MNSWMLIGFGLCGLIVFLLIVTFLFYYFRFTIKLLMLGFLARIGKSTSRWPLAIFDKIALDETIYQPREGEVLLAARKPNVVSQTYPAMWRKLRYVPALIVLLGYSLLFLVAGAALAFQNPKVLLLHPILMVCVFAASGLPVIYEYWARLWECLNSTYALFTHYLVILESKLPKGVLFSSGGLKRKSSLLSITSVRSIHDTKFGTSADQVYGRPSGEDEFETFMQEVLATIQAQWLRAWLMLPDRPITLGLIPGFSAGASDKLPSMEDAEAFVALIPDAAHASSEYETLRQRKLGAQAEGALGKPTESNWTLSEALNKFGVMNERFRALLAAGVLVIDPTPEVSRKGFVLARMQHVTNFEPGELRHSSLAAAAKVRQMANESGVDSVTADEVGAL